MLKVAIYSRKSRESDTGDSIENQIKMCKSYCDNHYLDEKIEYLVYQDEGFSGKNTDRPKFQELLKDIQDKKINKLICYRLDRISRSVADFSSTLELLQTYNCDFISIKEQFDTSTPMGRAMIYIASVFAQLERETIAERVRDNLIQMAKQGMWVGGSTPLGFDFKRVKYLDESLKERNMCILMPIEEQLECVKHIYNVYLSEESATKTVDILLKEGVKGKLGKTIQSMGVIRLLRNPIYVKSDERVHKYLASKCENVYGIPNENGYITYGKTKSDTKRTRNDESKWIYAVSNHKGIIDADTWLEVQKILDKNKNKQFKRTGTSKDNPALLSGLFKCKKCGSNMVVRRNGDKYYYVCSGKVNKIEHTCDAKNVRVDQIDSLILSSIEKYNKEIISTELQKAIKEVDNSDDFKNNNLENIQKSIQEKKSMISNLIERVALAPTNEVAEMIMNQISEINKEIKTLENELNDINFKMNKNSIDRENLMLFIESLNTFSKDIKDIDDVIKKRSLLQTIIKKITWDSDLFNADIEFLENLSEDFKKK